MILSRFYWIHAVPTCGLSVCRIYPYNSFGPSAEQMADVSLLVITVIIVHLLSVISVTHHASNQSTVLTSCGINYLSSIDGTHMGYLYNTLRTVQMFSIYIILIAIFRMLSTTLFPIQHVSGLGKSEHILICFISKMIL